MKKKEIVAIEKKRMAEVREREANLRLRLKAVAIMHPGSYRTVGMISGLGMKRVQLIAEGAEMSYADYALINNAMRG